MPALREFITDFRTQARTTNLFSSSWRGFFVLFFGGGGGGGGSNRHRARNGHACFRTVRKLDGSA